MKKQAEQWLKYSKVDLRYPSNFGLLPGGIPTINQINELYIYAGVIFSLAEDLIG